MKAYSVNDIENPNMRDFVAIVNTLIIAAVRFVTRQNLSDYLNEIIEKSKTKAQVMLNSKYSAGQIIILSEDFEELNDVFSLSFKNPKIESIEFQDKIIYCLSKLKREKNKLETASEMLTLEINFVEGAKKILPLYFYFESMGINYKNPLANYSINLNDGDEDKQKFVNIFTNTDDSNKFIELLNKCFKDENGELKIKNTLTAGFLNELRNRKIIKNITDTDIMNAINYIGITIPKSTFTTGKNRLNNEDLELLNSIFPKH